MATVSTAPLPQTRARAASPARPDDAPLGGAGALRSRLQLRLVIAMPVLMVLLVLCYGLVSYLSFSGQWDALEKLGAGEIAGDLLETHLVAMLILVAIGVASGLVLALTVLRPLRTMMEAARRVAGGELDGHLPELNAAPELEALSTSFNAMIDGLNAALAERYRLLLEGLPIGILTTDLNGAVSAASPSAAEILGLSVEWLTGRTVWSLAERVRPEAQPLLLRIGDGLGGGTDSGPADPGAAWHLTRASLRDGAGRVTGFVFSFREPVAVAQVAQHIRRTDELASLGAFALGLADQLRNPLGAVKGLGQLLQTERGLPPRAADYAARMIGEIDRVDLFVSRLLSLSERPLDAASPTDLSEAVRGALEAARREIGPAAGETAVELRLAPLPPLLLERERVAGALMQLIKNALEHAAPGGRVAIEAALDSDGATPLLRIRNSGAPIAEGDRERIFEPFFTTRPRATGLGLTFAREILAHNGATLTLEPGGDGVTFLVRFSPDRTQTEPEEAAR